MLVAVKRAKNVRNWGLRSSGAYQRSFGGKWERCAGQEEALRVVVVTHVGACWCVDGSSRRALAVVGEATHGRIPVGQD